MLLDNGFEHGVLVERELSEICFERTVDPVHDDLVRVVPDNKSVVLRHLDVKTLNIQKLKFVDVELLLLVVDEKLRQNLILRLGLGDKNQSVVPTVQRYGIRHWDYKA